MRKAADPNTSGVQTRRFSCLVESPSCMAAKVLRLNSKVPTNSIDALHHDGSAPKRRPRLSVPSRTSRPPASVKKIEPAKKTTPSAPWADELHQPGEGTDEEASRTNREASCDPAIPDRSGERLMRNGKRMADQASTRITRRRYLRLGGAHIARSG